MKNTYCVTGGCGFIGSFLVDALLDDPMTKQVRVIDNFSSGKIEHLYHQGANVDDGRLHIVRADLFLDKSVSLIRAFADVDTVFHLSANPNARLGIEDTRLDFEQESEVTLNILGYMRVTGCKKIIFASSGTVYGDVGKTVCREGQGERLPISLYGSGKVASEALISGFCGTFGMKSVIFRFGNVVGPRLSHGAIYDWLAQLKAHPDHLNVLGDGNQSKPFIFVSEIVAGMLHGLKLLEAMPDSKCEPYNLAPEGATSVGLIASMLLTAMFEDRRFGVTLHTKMNLGSTPAGWAGDVPNSRMSMAKLEATGFRLRRSSDEAVKYAIQEILKTI